MYQGVIKKSRTYDALAVLTALDVAFVILLEEATNLGISPWWYAIIRLFSNAGLAYLRHITNGPVGEKN